MGLQKNGAIGDVNAVRIGLQLNLSRGLAPVIGRTSARALQGGGGEAA